MSGTPPASFSLPAGLSKHLIDESELNFHEASDAALLGQGSFGAVRRARFNGQEVAVKTMLLLHNTGSNSGSRPAGGAGARINSTSTTEKKQRRMVKMFLDEADKMRHLKHPHIVKFVGLVATPMAHSIVMEFVALGSLRDYISKNVSGDDDQSLSWIGKFLLVRDIADGMAYLHSKKTKDGHRKFDIFHQDLKPENILLSLKDGHTSLRAKIADFGLSVMRKTLEMDKKATSMTALATESAAIQSAAIQSTNIRTNMLSEVNQIGGTQIYMAPELLSTTKFTKACDVYSHGVVMLELATMEPPELTVFLYRSALFDQKVNNAPRLFRDMTTACLNGSPGNRPSFKEIKEHIEFLFSEFSKEEAGTIGDGEAKSFNQLANEISFKTKNQSSSSDNVDYSAAADDIEGQVRRTREGNVQQSAGGVALVVHLLKRK